MNQPKLTSNKNSQSGFAHMIVIVVLVLAVVVGAGYMVYTRQQDSNKTAQSTQTPVKSAAVTKAADIDSSIKDLDKSNVDSDLDTAALDADLNAVL